MSTAPAPNPTPPPSPPGYSWTSMLIAGAGGVLLAAVLGGAGWLWYWWVHTNPLPDVVMPTTVTALPGRIVEIDVQTKATDLQWDSKNDPGEWDMVLIESGKKNFFVAPAAGVYTLQLRAILSGKIIGPFSCVVTVGTPGPIPPGPGPGPGPGPTPTPAPIPGDGLRVLAIYDPATLGKLSPDQRDVLYSETVRGWIRSHAAVGADGKTAESRFLPSNEDMTNETKTWQDAFKRPRQSLPWLIISNGKVGYEGPLPAKVADMMSLLQKYSP